MTPAGVALAQAPVITTISPLANTRAATRTGPLIINFSQPLTAASAGALKVFSAQRGGLRTQAATVNGNALSFAPTAYPFLPGETVQYAVTTAAAGSGGALARPKVGQFTVAVGGTGQGIFQPGSDPSVNNFPVDVVTGDIDGDGDLDIITPTYHPNSSLQISTRLNDGSGRFSGGQDLNVTSAGSLVVGDVDGDGDLDFLAINDVNGTVEIWLNNGGLFTSTPARSVSVGSNPQGLALGDVDGDGDLDVLTANASTPFGTISVRLNNGSGVFSGSQEVRVGSNPSLTLADVDNDGDLDILTTTQAIFGVALSIRSNDGTGIFGSGQGMVLSSTGPVGTGLAALSDLDGDGDLDLLTNGNGVGLFDNDGSGNFQFRQMLSTSPNSQSGAAFGLTVGDVNGDGAQDILTANYFDNQVNVYLNGGSGVFGAPIQTLGMTAPRSLTLGDVDGDGDLDFINASETSNTVRVRLNGGTVLAASAAHATAGLALFPNPAHGTATLAGAAPYAPLAVLDALGRTVFTAMAGADGTAQLVLPASLAPGLYLVRTGAQVQQLVVE